MKLYGIVKYLFALVFISSAFFKLLDLDSTVGFVIDLIGGGEILIKILMGILILTEIIVAYLSISDFTHKNIVFILIGIMIFAFLIFNCYLLVKGVGNCGCYGTKIVSTPLLSILKNSILMVGLCYLHIKGAKRRNGVYKYKAVK